MSRAVPTVEWPPARLVSRIVSGSLRVLRLSSPQSVVGGLALAWLVLLSSADGGATEYPRG